MKVENINVCVACSSEVWKTPTLITYQILYQLDIDR